MAVFAVVIPTIDRSGSLGDLVQRLCSLDGRPDRVVVVDDRARPHPPLALPPPVTDLADVSLVVAGGVGPASARNVGAAASGEAPDDWLIFLDDDDVPDDDYMVAFRRAVDEAPTARFVSFASRTSHDGVVRIVPAGPLGPAFSGLVGSFRAGSFAVHREVFDAIGGFLDGLYHGEMSNLVMRMAASLGEPTTWSWHSAAPHMTVVGRPQAERSSVQPEVLVTSGRRALASVEHLLRRDPTYYANSLGALGVAEIRRGEVRAGRAALGRAARIDPWPPRHVGRFLASCVGPLRRRVWGGA